MKNRLKKEENQSAETESESRCHIKLDFKVAIINVFKELQETIIKEAKYHTKYRISFKYRDPKEGTYRKF